MRSVFRGLPSYLSTIEGSKNGWHPLSDMSVAKRSTCDRITAVSQSLGLWAGVSFIIRFDKADSQEAAEPKKERCTESRSGMRVMHGC